MSALELTYVIRNVRTGKTIECHDLGSKEWAQGKVKTHNDLYPLDLWVLVEEWI